MRIQTLNHSTYQHLYHIVWGTKWNRKWLKEYIKPELINSFNTTIEKYPIFHIVRMNTDLDHVHIEIEIPPNVSVSSAVQIFKQRSSMDLKHKFKFIREIYIEKGSIWRVGYFSSTVGLNEELIRKYIDDQGRSDRPQPALF